MRFHGISPRAFRIIVLGLRVYRVGLDGQSLAGT